MPFFNFSKGFIYYDTIGMLTSSSVYSAKRRNVQHIKPGSWLIRIITNAALAPAL